MQKKKSKHYDYGCAALETALETKHNRLFRVLHGTGFNILNLFEKLKSMKSLLH